MASGTRSDDLANEIWGTWEELLLASAVNRHGTRSWDSVAMEIQARSPFSVLLTPQTCRRRYLDLKRRFESVGEGIDEESDVAGRGEESGSPADVPWLEELRKIRMAELRREVDRYDVSITSLQLKLKNLRAERERNDAGDRDPDPKDNETIKDGESPEPAPDAFARDLNSVGNSSGSCKESNSTDPKEKDVNPNGGVETEPEKTPDDGAQDDMPHPTGEDSYNGSSETLSKGSETADGAALLLGESGESVAGGKESSDVQSSASLSKRRRGKRQNAISGGSSVAEAETDAVSAVAVNVKRPATAESQPLATFLEIIQSNKYGSIFMRRLEGQENSRYRGTIRRYVDLEMVRTRLERKGTKYSTAEFFRDLLLLCNNAIVFFHKGSTESTAAVNLRQMVSKEMASILPKPVRAPTEEAAREPSLPLSKIVPKIKLDTDLKNPLPKKNRSSGSLIACRKRSSFSKVPAISDAETTAGKEERDQGSDSDHQEQERVRDEDKLSPIAKPKTKERSKVSGARGLRTNKIRGGPGGSALKQSKPAPAPKPGLIAAETLELPPKVEKKDLSPPSNLTPKKKNAASFLNRLKGNSGSSSATGTLLSSLKSSGGGSIGKGSELKRGGKGEGRKEATTVPSPELIAPAKRSVGRPPKRMAPALTPSPPPKRMKVDAALPAKRLPAQPQKKRGKK
ncbi:hypothetical protein KSP39_PZI000095 [Platanthera zijinensis]|uniref:Bromo domain-containing protein n=1 Tax=Platanthera zijinensis TaxID=2320716 RepID=A0AAP0GFF1_9ASPA